MRPPLKWSRICSDDSFQMDCHCFQLCSPDDWAELQARLWQRPTSVWLTYLSTVYGEPLQADMVPYNLQRSELYYPKLLPTRPCFRPSALPKCANATCLQWLRPMPRPSLLAAALAARSERTFVMSSDGMPAGPDGVVPEPEWVLSQEVVSHRRPHSASSWVEVVRRSVNHLRGVDGRWLFPEGAGECACFAAN